MEYKPTIGLEIHAELKTRTKMFCDSLNDADEKKANKNVCPVCLGQPGALPTINKEAIKHVIRVGLALGGKINPVTKFDRKNYFYPDLPKGYQISQYDQPLVIGGNLLGVRLRRIHLEEDTGTLVHAGESSLVDFNRGGVPLMELVTEPDITSAEQAAEFGKELQLILRYLGVSDADMEKGHMRLEANVSLNMGTKVELKNINSFRAMKDAVTYELARQEELLRAGKKVSQETRGWDEANQKTVSQRSKEEAHDYRYFPEPDLPPFSTEIFEPEFLARELPELPQAKRTRFAKEYDLEAKQVELLVSEPAFASYFEEAASELKAQLPATRYSLLANYLLSDVRGMLGEQPLKDSKLNPEHLAHLVFLLNQSKITSRQAKDMLAKMLEKDADPETILKDESQYAISDTGELEKIVGEIVEETPQAVADYKKGKAQSLQFLIGKAMGRLKGRGNPEILKKLILEALSK
ncbi:MAG: Asp-tRNA(Asn)/Glu-tRNA(Gln) amidotransferase subunit GatB [Candidatus Liptonbacteria bacterium]|nr:Asp-tRNA(Asn)/Glu-tRNA(Gln) amidotransferase subunit GatB [Candidatus Liptonbacteria bacterium]